MRKQPFQECGISKVMKVLGGKWRFVILWRIYQQEGIRFNQLQRAIEGITNVVLTRCLNDLIKNGFVEKRDYQTTPPHVEYFLTDLSKNFLPIIQSVHHWGNENL